METDTEPAPVVYHLHIPKTAGTSLYAALETRFPPEKVCPVRISSLDLIHMPPEELRGFDLIGGHLEFGYYLPEILGRPVRPVTLLREPRAVLLSLYKQVMQEPLDPIRAYADEHCPTLEAFFFDPEMARYVADSQTRFLAVGERRFTPETIRRIRGADPDEVASIVCASNVDAPRPSPQEMLRIAFARLEECAVVGLVERMEESIARICATFGWPPPAHIPRNNVSRVEVTEHLPPHLLARLDQLSSLDRVLYRHVAKRFDEAAAP